VTQLGYASGYASEFFDTLIMYKEVQCSAEGHRHCRVVGKPAEVWGSGDPEVILFRERIAAQLDERPSEPRRAPKVRRADAALTDLDRIILAPVRKQLDCMAPMALPMLTTGAAGTGRNCAARYLHGAIGGTGADLRCVDGSEVTSETCAEIAGSGRKGRRGAAVEAIVIDGVERVPDELQRRLTRALEDGLVGGGPQVFALSCVDFEGAPTGASWHPELWYGLSALTVRMPPLAERPADRLAIAHALLPTIAARMNLLVPKLDPGAATAIEQASWPGNLRQMRSVLSAVLAAHRQEGPVTRTEVEAGYDRSARVTSPADAGKKAGLGVWLDGALADGRFSMASFEREAYGAAVARADGNLSAAARLLGLTRAQLAYRRRTGNLGA
jgi:DNA-binding NtrC family response regulator